ncbi:MAG: tRNA (guanosine(37)-N1)-methyltransferase TrmD [Treponemataceae bacterium]
MKFSVLTLFPEIVDAYFSASIMGKALERGVLAYRSVNIRDFALDKHHKCDDPPYGGGAGMLMLPEPLGRALESVGATVKSKTAEAASESAVDASAEPLEYSRPRVVYLSPSGRPFDQAFARELSAERELVLLCGRYEGIDQRIIDEYVDDEVSIGDYVLSSGEIAALVVIDAVYRLVDGVITPESLDEESFSDGLLEYPQYTRPEVYGNLRVPELLLSGHHENIRRWRLGKRVDKTLAVRPELIRRGLRSGVFSAETMELIKQRDGAPAAPEFEGDQNERD